ncbi:MAG: 5'-methylthioadenosine/adenosylhomocysteine nucleosidase [Ruminococcaceae bacterium]|nr:5'-methylthioadenosine/adenosylhomocysteine nucleosidase [Oscillospiraceae bacterium]
MLGIIGAMDIEINKLIDAMEVEAKTEAAGITFHKGVLKGCSVVVARSGVGKVCAAVCAQLMVTLFGVDAIVNTGVAGGIMSDLRQCDIIVADAFVQHDVDTSPLGDPRGYISELGVVEMVCSHRLSSMLCDISAEARQGQIATGDQFIADHEHAMDIAVEFGAAACDMEGGAIAQVCKMNGVRFAAVRCISDNADGSAGLDYTSFAAKAADKCAGMVIELAARMAQA